MTPHQLRIGVYDRDDDLIDATCRDRQARVRVYRYTHTVVVIGRGSKPEVELYVEHCIEDGMPVLKRHGGGCAVLLDPGNVIVSVTLPIGGILGSQRWFRHLNDWLIEGLARIGVRDVRREGVCDLALGDRKVSGACIHRSKDLLFHTATLLVSPDIAKVERYLRHPPREPSYRRGRPHAEFMGALAPLPAPGGVEGFVDGLQKSLPPLPIGP